MTSVAATFSVDSRGGCALYLMSDSRFTWASSGKHWDAAQKTFACRNSPDIFGFCGDAFFPPTILRALVDLADLGCIFGKEETAEERHIKVAAMFRVALEKEKDALKQDFYVFHGARQGNGMQSEFKLWELHYSPHTRAWIHKQHALNKTESVLALSGGTGGAAIRTENMSWIGTDVDGKSRSVAWSFFDAIESGADPASGGPPQITGLWRIGNGRTFGLVWQGKRYVSGMELPDGADTSTIDWFNKDFERCDGQTGLRKKGATKHVRP